MASEVDIAAAAAMLADPTRVELLAALAGGVARPAGELARLAGASASATSVHLARLREAGMVTVERQGRHRYYRLGDPAVIEAFESLARLAKARPVQSLKQHRQTSALRAGRRCYKHLAGALGVAVTDAMHSNGWIVETAPDTWELSDVGHDGLSRLTIDVTTLRSTPRRPLLQPCLDWTERRHHLAGPVATALLSTFLERDWLRASTDGRAITLSDTGATHLMATFGPR